MIKATERILRFFLTAVGMAGFCLFLLHRLYRIMLDADCRKYNDEAYFHGYRRALQFTQTKMEETLEFYRQLFGSFLAGAVAVVIYIRMDQMIVVFVLLAICGKPFLCQKVWWKKRTKSGMNRTKRMHCIRTIYGFFCERNMQQRGGFWAAYHFS